MTQTVSAFAALITPLIGRAVIVTDNTGAETEYKIAKLSDKLGSLKDGSKGEYVVLQRADDEAIVINVHPSSAKRLVTKGEEAGMKLVPTQSELSADEQQAVQEELAEEQASTEAAEPVTEEQASTEAAEPAADAPAAEVKGPSKKELFMAIYKAGAAAGKDRKTIKADCASIGLSDAGFNTYYQSAKSGKWV